MAVTSIEELKARKAWLLRVIAQIDRELEKRLRESGAPPKPRPQSLPGIPAHQRQASESEEDFAEFQATRAGKFKRLGVPLVPDRMRTGVEYSPAFINTALKRLRETIAGVHSDPVAARAELWLTFTAFFSEDYPARYNPPYPFEAFVSPKVFPKLLDRVRAERAASTTETH